MLSKKFVLTSILLSSSVLLNGCDLLESESHNTPAKIAQIPILDSESHNTPAEIAQIPIEEDSTLIKSESQSQIKERAYSDLEALFKRHFSPEDQEQLNEAGRTLHPESSILDNIKANFIINKIMLKKSSEPEVLESIVKLTRILST